MGVVVAATHAELGTQVAVKFMLPAALTGADSVDRFLREARAASRLRSDHVCRVLDVGRLDHGAPYIVMEMLEGCDVQETLDREGALPLGTAAAYVSQVCEAIGEAHAAGIVHRDLKPQNLFLTRKLNGVEVVKVLDFGISKVAGSADAVRTHEAAIMGTPAYMSPEQCQSSKHVDGRTDIWALGVILYQLSTGRLPFDGADFLQIAMSITTKAPVPPSVLRPDLPAGFDTVVMRCLEKERGQRFGSAQDLAAALQPFIGAAPGSARTAWSHPTVVVGTAPKSAPITTLGGAARTVPTVDSRRRNKIAPALAGAGVVGALVFALALCRGRSQSTTTSSPAAGPAPSQPSSATEPASQATPNPTLIETAPSLAPAVVPPAPEGDSEGDSEPPAKDAATASKPSDVRSTKKRSKATKSKATVDAVGAQEQVDEDGVTKSEVDTTESGQVEIDRLDAERKKVDRIEVKDEDVFKK
ncbi:MAG: protein kinase [Myxococcales bacterium]|nr:protein kinase [Myxococcales bacterium]